MPRIKSIIVMIMAATLGLLSTPTLAEPPTTEQRTEFFRIKAERDKLYREKDAVTHQATEETKKGNKPVELLARIEALKDQIEQKEDRLRILGVKYGMEVPPPPQPAKNRKANGKRDPQDYFQGGKAEVIRQLRMECNQFLNQLNFVTFLNASS